MEEQPQNIVQNKEYFIEKGDLERERANFKKALFYYKKAKEYGSSYKIDLGIAHTLRISGDFEGALKIYDKVSKNYKKKEIIADSYLGEALSLKGLSKTEEAIRFLKKAEKIYESLNDDLACAHLFWAYSVLFRVTGDFKDSLEYGEKALSMFNFYNDKKGILYSNCALGGLNRILGNLNESFEYYSKANELAKNLKDKFGIAYSYCGIGNFYRMVKDFKKAIECFKKAEEFYVEIGDIVSFSYTLWSLGVLKTIERNYKESEDCFKRALGNFEKTKDKRGSIYCYLGLIQMKFLKNEDYSNEIINCNKIFEKYKLKWEKLLFKILLSKIKREKKEFKDDILSFGSNYKFDEFPLNLP